MAHTCNPAIGETQAGDLKSIACLGCEICLTICMAVGWLFLFVCFRGLFLCVYVHVHVSASAHRHQTVLESTGGCWPPCGSWGEFRSLQEQFMLLGIELSL